MVVCKHTNLDVMAMHTRLELMNQLSIYLSKRDGTRPNRDELFTQEDVKVYWAQSMPSVWIDKWKDLHPGPAGEFDQHEITFDTLLDFFQGCETKEGDRKDKDRQ